MHTQFGILGQIINVPVSINTMVNRLPRNVDDDYFVKVHIKWRKINRTSYLMGKPPLRGILNLGLLCFDLTWIAVHLQHQNCRNEILQSVFALAFFGVKLLILAEGVCLIHRSTSHQVRRAFSRRLRLKEFVIGLVVGGFYYCSFLLTTRRRRRSFINTSSPYPSIFFRLVSLVG
ncbi:hypothetical protein TNCV_2534241 [Trichonephila clavipes]|nr:hypothetical protein TNCV_2534241 [Trichonephila clavipes]